VALLLGLLPHAIVRRAGVGQRIDVLLGFQIQRAAGRDLDRDVLGRVQLGRVDQRVAARFERDRAAGRGEIRALPGLGVLGGRAAGRGQEPVGLMRRVQMRGVGLGRQGQSAPRRHPDIALGGQRGRVQRHVLAGIDRGRAARDQRAADIGVAAGVRRAAIGLEAVGRVDGERADSHAAAGLERQVAARGQQAADSKEARAGLLTRQNDRDEDGVGPAAAEHFAHGARHLRAGSVLDPQIDMGWSENDVIVAALHGVGTIGNRLQPHERPRQPPMTGADGGDGMGTGRKRDRLVPRDAIDRRRIADDPAIDVGKSGVGTLRRASQYPRGDERGGTARLERGRGIDDGGIRFGDGLQAIRTASVNEQKSVWKQIKFHQS
jgi:hypothetical protein